MNARRGAAALLALVVLASGCGAAGTEVRADAHGRVHDPKPEATSSTRDTGSDDEMARAVVTAVQFVCSAQRLLDASPADLGDVVRSMWVASEADQALSNALDRLSALRSALGDGTGPTRVHQAVLAVRVESATAERVVVSIWSVSVVYREGAAEPQSVWMTYRVTMEPESAAWKVADSTGVYGPTPAGSVDQAPSTASEITAELDGFVDWYGQ